MPDAGIRLGSDSTHLVLLQVVSVSNFDSGQVAAQKAASSFLLSSWSESETGHATADSLHYLSDCHSHTTDGMLRSLDEHRTRNRGHARN